MSVGVLDGDQYLIYLNSSDVETNANGSKQSAEFDSDFTTAIRPMNLSPHHQWVVGLVDLVIYNPNETNSPVAPNQQPVKISCDIGVDVRDGSDTTNILYTTKPLTPALAPAGALYYGEKNISTPISWRPIRNRNIQNINVKVQLLFGGQFVQYDPNVAGAKRGFNSITLCIKKVK
jgi:hypothetical protein